MDGAQPIITTGMTYVCGNCGQDTEVKPSENTIRCQRCGNRILYKKRTRGVGQFEAR